MKETKQSLSELWALLRNKEKQLGIDNLSLTDRDVFQTILYLQHKSFKLYLDVILKNCNHPRATFFRSIKKLRLNKYIKVTKDNKDGRKSIIKISPQYKN